LLKSQSIRSLRTWWNSLVSGGTGQ
jgi:hypothetical protein